MRNLLFSFILVMGFNLEAQTPNIYDYPIKCKECKCKLSNEDTTFIDELSSGISEQLLIKECWVAKSESIFSVTFFLEPTDFVRTSITFICNDGFIVSECKQYEYPEK